MGHGIICYTIWIHSENVEKNARLQEVRQQNGACPWKKRVKIPYSGIGIPHICGQRLE
jgi:hypothetical protein